MITHYVSSKQNKKDRSLNIQMEYNFKIECGKLLVNQKINQPKVLISDDRHENIHTSSSSKKSTITNKNIHTLNKHRTDVNIQ